MTRLSRCFVAVVLLAGCATTDSAPQDRIVVFESGNFT